MSIRFFPSSFHRCSIRSPLLWLCFDPLRFPFLGEKSGKKKNSKSSTNLAQEAAGSSSAGIGAKDGQAGGISRQPAVDDEGYSIPPVNPWVEPKGDSSSSEEEEDQDDRFRAPKVGDGVRKG